MLRDNDSEIEGLRLSEILGDNDGLRLGLRL